MKNRLLAMLLLGFCTIAYAEPDFLVDADWLADNIEEENLVVLEVRYHPHRYYTVGHIPGAIQIQRLKDLGDNHATPPMRFPSHEVFQKRLRAWGVNDYSTLVLYDDSRTVDLAPVFHARAVPLQYGTGEGAQWRHARLVSI